ncbi:MAG: aldehyde dehydrogenase family protein, partial [Anaerolineales bacterium]|nr:aldehyde dehydrogenase family protein [Anaerolineales bacterium]
MTKLKNYINGEWVDSSGSEYQDVINPATYETMCQVPLSPAADVARAAEVAAEAQKEWRQMPAVQRVQYLFKMKAVMDEHFEEIAQIITKECGKTIGESRGEMIRAIENVEVACGIPMLMQGDISEDIAGGIDELMIRQPVGVAAAVVPFNFPGMITFWFLPYALACGNTYIVKPSEKVPMTMQYIFELFDEHLDLPPGALNLVHGNKVAVDEILQNPIIRAISFVGSTAVARYIYSEGAKYGKRVQAQGGAKNPILVLPDADIEMTTRIAADSAFGCAGQRCLAASIAITVGEARHTFTEAIADAAAERVVGYGLEEAVQMGTVIDKGSQARIESLIQKGADEGANVLVDGRNAVIPNYENGSWVRPTILQDVD